MRSRAGRGPLGRTRVEPGGSDVPLRQAGGVLDRAEGRGGFAGFCGARVSAFDFSAPSTKEGHCGSSTADGPAS